MLSPTKISKHKKHTGISSKMSTHERFFSRNLRKKKLKENETRYIVQCSGDNQKESEKEHTSRP